MKIKVHASILIHADVNGLPLGGYHGWSMAKDWEQGGAGYIPAKEFKQYLKELGIAKSTYSRWIKEAYEIGLFQKAGKGLIKLASWEKAGKLAGCPKLEQPALIDLDKFINAGWMDFVWAGFLKNHEGIIARATLKALSGGVPERTQRYRERRAGVENQANYASFGKVKDYPEQAVSLYGEPGHYQQAGEIRRRLPNSRTVPDCVQKANKGRIKKINLELGKKSFHDAASNNSTVYRLYADNYEQTKSIKRKDRKLDDMDRPNLIYELAKHITGYKTGNQIGVYFAIAL